MPARSPSRLARHYADAQCALHFASPLQLLIATILSAQCTDERVNMVTPELVPAITLRPPTSPRRRSRRNRADHPKHGLLSQQGQKHQGVLPAARRRAWRRTCRKTSKCSVSFAGIGRKTANVVLGTAFGIPSGVVVDTHVGRLSIRLGLTKQTDPESRTRFDGASCRSAEWIAFASPNDSPWAKDLHRPQSKVRNLPAQRYLSENRRGHKQPQQRNGRDKCK